MYIPKHIGFHIQLNFTWRLVVTRDYNRRRRWSSVERRTYESCYRSKQIVNKNLENLRLEQCQLSRDIAWVYLLHLYNSCNYGICISSGPFTPWATCMLTCRGVTRHTLKKRFCFCRNTLGPLCHGTECVANSRVSVPTRLLWTPGVQRMSCVSVCVSVSVSGCESVCVSVCVCVYSMIMRQHISPAAYCVLSVQLQRAPSSWQTTMPRSVLPILRVISVS